jgi:flagellar hook-length control protein FliK
VLEQVKEGVPLEQVLAQLVERLEEDTELVVPPGMMPSLSAALQSLADGEPAGLSQLAEFRGQWQRRLTEQPAGSMAQPAAEPDAEIDVDLLVTEPGAGKDKPSLVGRLANLAEPPANLSPVSGPQQPAPMRPSEFAAQLGASLAAAADTDSGELMQLQPRVGETGWGQALAQRVMWLIGREQQSAQLRLNPAELGPLEVKVTLQQDQASVSLLASNAAVRDALEQALPRLRDMLGQQDIQLVQVNVGQRDASGGQQAAAGHAGGQGGHGERDAAPHQASGDEEAMPTQRLQSRGLLDTYA